MNRAEKLAAKWSNAREMMPGATIHLPEGEALVLDKGPERGQWWAWSVTLQAFVLVQDHTARKRGWYEYRDGLGRPLGYSEEASA